MRIDLYVTVWGAAFVEKFLRFSLASQLAPANLPAISESAELVYHVYTDRASHAAFASGIEPLWAHADVRFHFYEDVAYRGGTLADAMANAAPAGLKHNVQRVTAHHFLRAAAEAKSDAAVLLDSDFIFADGAFPALLSAYCDGARAVCAMFLRLEEGVAAPALDGALANGIAARDLVRLGLDALHPGTAAMFVDADPFTAYPSQLNWRVGADGFVTHCFFPHPLLLVPSGPVHYASTMDYELALRAVDDDAAIRLVPSSDELLVCKMTPASYGAAAGGAPPTVAGMARYVVSNTNIRHRRFMEQPIRFAAGGDEADWRQVEDRSRRFVEAVYKAAELVIAGARTDPRTMVFLKSFLGPIGEFVSPQVAARLAAWL